MGMYKSNLQLVGPVHPAKTVCSAVAPRQTTLWRHSISCQKVLCWCWDFTFLNSRRSADMDFVASTDVSVPGVPPM